MNVQTFSVIAFSMFIPSGKRKLVFYSDTQGLCIENNPLRTTVNNDVLGHIIVMIDVNDDSGMQLTLDFPWPPGLSADKIKDAGAILADELLDRLALEGNFGPGDARLTFSNLDVLETLPNPVFKARTSGNVAEISASDSIAFNEGIAGVSKRRVLIVNSGDEQRLIEALQIPFAGDKTFRRIYRDALKSPDPIAQFMILYMLLSTIESDKKTELDDWIIKQDPQTPTTPSPKTGKPETVYSRLRNEVGHGSERRVPVNQTRQEIVSNLTKFKTLVREKVLSS